jgi:glycosyltransferase involved in cell wall biosynthesis
LKIIQITPAYKPAYIYGGPTMSVAKLCEAIVHHAGANLTVFTTTANGLEELAVVPGKEVKVDDVPVIYFSRLTKDHTHFSPALLLALRKEIKNQKVKPIIHIHSWWNLVTVLSCLIAKWHRIPVVLSPRGMLTNYTQNNRNSFFKSALHILLGKSLLQYVHIIASSEQERQDVLKIIKPKSITILPNLVSLPKEPIAINQAQGNIFKLLFLSRIEEKKGLAILFEALANLTMPWELSIGGKGEEAYVQRLKDQAADLKISAKIAWLGHVNNDDKFDLLAKHDLLVLTSYNENFANVVIESLHVGTPVLVSKEVGLSEYVAANGLGFVSELNPLQITETLKQAFTDSEKRRRIRTQGPIAISKDFDEQILVAKHIALYKQILHES